MYPTVLDIIGVTMGHQPVIDGVSLLAMFEGRMESRPKPIGFTRGRYAVKDDPTQCQLTDAAWIDGRHMLRLETARKSDTETIALYGIAADPDQRRDLAAKQPEKVKEMLKALAVWRESGKASFAGKDYIR